MFLNILDFVLAGGMSFGVVYFVVELAGVPWD